MKSPNKKTAVLCLCILTYIMAYLCRLNFSSAILKISAAMDVTTATMGAVGSLFFIAYAIGQLVNGFLGDRIPPARFIIVAIIGTGAVNFAMTFAQDIWAVRCLWVLNGYFQSIFWAACNRILSYYYADEEHHIISTGMSLSMVASYILSWAILGKLLIDATWQSYFLIPAIVTLFMFVIWFLFARMERVVQEAAAKNKTLNRQELFATVKADRLWLVCCVCIFTGLVKEGIGLWAPVIFLAILGGDISQSLLFIVLIPLGNFCGIMLTERLLKKNRYTPYQILRVMLFCLALCALGILFASKFCNLAAVFFTAAVSAMALGCNSLLLSYIPLSYAGQNIVSTLIGMFNFSAYLGAALSAYVLGIFLNEGNWHTIPLLWIGAGIIGALLVSLAMKQAKKKEIL